MASSLDINLLYCSCSKSLNNVKSCSINGCDESTKTTLNRQLFIHFLLCIIFWLHCTAAIYSQLINKNNGMLFLVPYLELLELLKIMCYRKVFHPISNPNFPIENCIPSSWIPLTTLPVETQSHLHRPVHYKRQQPATDLCLKLMSKENNRSRWRWTSWIDFMFEFLEGDRPP